MKHTLYIIAAIVTLALTSCETPISFRGEVQDPMLVLHSEPQAGVKLQCYLSRSYFVFDQSYRQWAVGGARVEYRVDDGPWTEMTPPEGLTGSGFEDATLPYTCDHVCQPGETIGLRASHKDYPSVSSSQVVPAKPKFEMTEVKRVKEERVRFTLAVQQPDGPMPDQAYYRLRLWSSSSYYNPEAEPRMYRNRYLYTSDATLMRYVDKGDLERYIEIFDEEYESYYSEFYVPASELEGKSVWFEMEDYWDSSEPIHSRSARVEVMAMTYEQYRYLRSSDIGGGEYYEDDEILDMFGEPTQIYCNIHGGIGHMGAIAATSVLIEKLP